MKLMATPDNHTHEGMVYEPVFRTSKGSVYYFNKEHALWLRRRKRGQEIDTITGEIVVGSLRIPENTDYTKFSRNFRRGIIERFAPRFAIDRKPFGIRYPDRQLGLDDFVTIEHGRIRLKEGLNSDPGLEVHIGHNIREIYERVDPLGYGRNS